MRLAAVLVAVFGGASALQAHRSAHLFRRDASQACSDLTIGSNNGNRKVAIVIDASPSMAGSDPNSYRIAAAIALNKFLLPASSGHPDQVSVVYFGESATLLYPLGDPAGATQPISTVGGDDVGTEIYTGVDLGVMQVNATANTAHRSAVVVFTDGEDDYTPELVAALTNAQQQGIRVSFGYLSNGIGTQDPSILTAIQGTRGIYASIVDSSGSQNFVNYALLNGLTDNDNPQGYDERLLPGLGQTYVIANSSSNNLLYGTQAGENFNFTIFSISAGDLNATAYMGGKALSSTDETGFLSATSPSDGDVVLTVTSGDAVQQGLFAVVTDSDLPIKNCTVGVSSGSGSGALSPGAKAGIAIGVIAAVAIIAVAGVLAAKALTAGGTGVASQAAHGSQAINSNAIEKLPPTSNVTTMGPGLNQPLNTPGGMPGGHAVGPSSVAPTHGSGLDPQIGPSGPGGAGGPGAGFSGLQPSGPGAVSGTGGVGLGASSTGAAAAPTELYAPLSGMASSGGASSVGVSSGAMDAAYLAPLAAAVSLSMAAALSSPSSDRGNPSGGEQVPQTQPFQQALNQPYQQAPMFQPAHYPHATSGSQGAVPNTYGGGPQLGGSQPYGGNYSGPVAAPALPLVAPAAPLLGRERPKHHHHEWMAADEACTDPQCMLNDPTHWCHDPSSCPCTCRLEHCPVS